MWMGWASPGAVDTMGSGWEVLYEAWNGKKKKEREIGCQMIT